MAMDDKGGMSGYSKPKNNPNGKKKIKARQDARKAFVESKPGMDKKEARKRFFVQTRMAEAAKSGKKLDKKALRQKFESGDVRKGFGAPKKKTGGTTTGSTGSTGSSRVNLGNTKSYDPSKKTPYKPFKPSGPKKYAK